jgi:hypothetical protein
MLDPSRRKFITLLGGALADQAIAANAQEPVRLRTVGVLMGFRKRCRGQGSHRGLSTRSRREGLVPRAKPSHRVPLCRRRLRAHAGACERVGGAQA